MATRMKVLLTQPVEKLGSAGEIKEVSGGYGRNYLIPKGFAVLATRGQIKQANERQAAEVKKADALRTDAQALASRLAGVTLSFVERGGPDGRLYGSVTSADIAQKIQQELGIEVDRRKIELDEPLKRVGSYQVAIRLMAGLAPALTIVVDDEQGSGAAAAAAPAEVELPEPGDDTIADEE